MSKYQTVLVTIILAAGAFAESADGQSVVQERVSRINWESALSDGRQARLTPTLTTFRDRNEGELSSIRMPVLVASPSVVEAVPRLGGQGNSYAVVYTLPSAKLSILGTSVYLQRSDGQLFAQASTPGTRQFDSSEDGSDLSFTKYGASYVLRLSCANPSDERCTSERFLNSIANSLIVIGGRQ